MPFCKAGLCESCIQSAQPPAWAGRVWNSRTCCGSHSQCLACQTSIVLDLSPAPLRARQLSSVLKSPDCLGSDPGTARLLDM